jgi:hypothetical protein
MNTTARTFKPLKISKLRSVVTEVAKEHDVPTLTFPSQKPELESAAEEAGEGVAPEKKQRTARKQNPAPLRRVAVDLPEYLIKAIATKGAEDGVTKRYLFLKAFRDGGFVVHDVDLMEDGRRDV